MAGSSLLVLIDDIATILDDVSAMSKVAARQTAGVLGDDLAVNAEQVSGVRADRELPVVWAVARGSLRNKMIIVPGALLLSAVAPWLITPVLMLGGLYLCYEGFDKLAEAWFSGAGEKERHHRELLETVSDPRLDPVDREKRKIRGAIRTDFILSLEIIVITLGIVAESDFITRVLVLTGIALCMTVGVYGLVAGIVKIDDAGLYLSRRPGEGLRVALVRRSGKALLAFAPILMKSLSVLGTAAMFMVGGGILVHSLHPVENFLEQVMHGLESLVIAAPLLDALGMPLLSALFGMAAGALVVTVVMVARRLSGNGD